MLDEQAVETTLYSLAPLPPCLPERRNDERHMSLLRVGSLVIGDRRELCLIRNVSVGGMLIRAYSAIEPGVTRAGDFIEFEAISDCIVALSNCPMDVIVPVNGSTLSPVHVQVWES